VNSSFLIRRKSGLEWLVSPNLAQFPWILHAFSTRRGGASKPPAAGLNLGTGSRNQSPAVLKNRRLFLEAIRATAFSLDSVHQIHSAEILHVTRRSKTKVQYRPSAYESAEDCSSAEGCGDALVTIEPRILLSVRTADCLPILLVDPDLRAVAAIHSGWRGALTRVAEKTVGGMRRTLGSNPQRLFAAVGPSIRACCYEVGEEVVDAFAGSFVNSERYFEKATESATGKRGFPEMSFLSMTPPGHERPIGSGFCLDLVAVAVDQLLSAGVPASHIRAANFCTSCHSGLFFSYRKEGSATGRMMAAIGIRG
jgi:YfiH family protein